jgi:hypothetical protein
VIIYCAICIFCAGSMSKREILTELITGFPHVLCKGAISLQLI